MDVKLVANGTLDVTNTSVNTMLGSYTAEWISVDNTGRIGDATKAVTTLTATIGDIEIANSGTDAIVENVELVTDGNVYLSGSGFGEGISVKAFNLSLYGADIALENSTVETIYMTENSSFEYADGGELTLKAGSVIGKVNGYNGDTDKATGTVIFDGANLTDTAVQDVSKVVLASGTAHSIGKDSVFNDYREFYTEELNIASGAAFNFEHNDTSAADLHIGTTVSVDGTRVAVTGEGAMNVSNDGSEAYSMDNFDVSGFAGTLNVTTGTLVALEEDEDHVAATGTVNADGTVELNGTTVADIDFAITGAGSVKVNENKNFTGDISAYTGEYVIADDKTATYTADATLASDMTINGEGTADFADRTNPATVTLMSDTTTTPDIELHSNSAKLNGGAFGVIEGTANVDVIADSTAEDVKIGTMTVKAGKKLDVVGDGITATSGVVETTGDITLESGTDTVRTILNAAVAISAYGDINAGDYVTTTAQEVVVAGNIAYGDNAKMEVTSTDAAMGNITADAAITFGDNAEVTATNDITAGTDMTFGTDADVTATDITAAGNVTFGDTATVTASGNITAGTDVTFGTDADVTATDITATTGNVTFGDTATVTASGNIAAGKNVTFGAGTTATVGGDIWSGMMNAGEGIFAADNVKVSANDIYGKEIEFGDNAQVTVKRLNSSSDITFGSDAEVTAKHIIADNNITFGDNATVNASGNITGNDVGAITFGDNSEITVGGDIEASTALTTDPATGTITFGAENTVDVTGRISAVNAINVGVATELTAGKIYTPGALNISEHAKVTTNDIDAANINISILVPDASGFTGPSITLTAAVAKEKLGTLTIDADRSDFVSPYTVIDGVSSQLYNDLLVFVVGSESVNLNVNTAVAQEIAGYWVYGYVDNGDLLLDRMLVDNGEIFVNSDWTDNKGDRFYWGGNDVAHQHIVGNDAAKTLGYAASIVRAKADGSASNIYIVKGDTYEVDDLTLMTAANGVSKLVLSGDEVEAGTPDVAAGDALILGNLYGTDGSSATSLTLNNIAVKGNFFGGANNVALGGDVSTVINNASTAAAMRGMVFGGSNITSDIDDSAYSSTISLIGGGYSGSMVGGGAYVDGVSYAMKDSTISVAAGEGGERTVISGRLFGGSVAANGATVTQESANINIDLSNGQVYLRNDVYAAGANISGGSVNVAEANVSINGDLSNLNFTGRLSGGVYGTAIGSAANTVSDLTFSDATGTFKGLIQDFDTITISGNSAVTFSRKQTLTADTYFVFDLNGRTSADAMFTVNSFGWTYGDTITINTFDGVSGDYTLVGNWSDSYGVNLMIGSTAATIGSTATVNGNDYTLNVVNDALVLSYVGNNGVGLVDGAELSFANQTIAAGSDGRALSFDGSGDYTDGTVNLTDSTVDGDVYTGRYGEVALNTQGDTTIKGDISGYAKLVELTVESGKTTIEGTLSSGTGDDKVAVAAGAELAAESVSTGTNDDLIEISGTMNVTNDIQTGTDEDKINVADGASLSAAVIEMGTGDDTLVVGKNATLTATEISGGTNNDHLTLEKGAFVTADDVTMIETMSIDVDSVLNAGHYSWSTKPLTVTGVAGLTTDVAGAKTIFTNCNANKAINFDGVDAVLGTATQIAGTATTADTSDDVWASLSKVNNNLVVAWGRTETECGAALDAFKADTTLNLGEALVAVDDSLLNGFDSTDNTTKKSNGTLA